MSSDEVMDNAGDDLSPDVQIQALEELQLGKRSLVMKDIRTAVEHFSNACQLFDSIYGSGAPECAQAYLLYGSVLLDVSRLDNGVVDNNKLPNDGLDESMDDEEDYDEEGEEAQEAEADTSAKDVPETAEANAAAAKPSSEAEAGSSAKDAGDKAEANDSEAKPLVEASEPSTSTSAANTSSASTSAFEDPQPSTSKGEEPATETEEDMNDAELAWQMLDMARKIFTDAEPSLENSKMLAETLQKLGEISLEWENVENALSLLTECLDIRKQYDIHPRVIAQTYHFLALATASHNEYDKSVAYMKDALSLLETYHRNQQQMYETETDGVKKASHKLEIDDIESLLPEVQLQLDEYIAQEKTGYQSLSALEDEVDKTEKAARTSDAADKPVNNISNLVRRKVEPVAVNGNGTNGTNGNGVATEAEKVQDGDSVPEIKRKIDDVEENSDPKEGLKKPKCTEETKSDEPAAVTDTA